MIGVIKVVESKFKIVALGTIERKSTMVKGGPRTKIGGPARGPMSQGVVIVMANDAVVSISDLTAKRTLFNLTSDKIEGRDLCRN